MSHAAFEPEAHSEAPTAMYRFGLPGRIQTPNSRPRAIALLALGARGAAILGRVNSDDFRILSMHDSEGGALAGDIEAIRAHADKLHKTLAGADMLFMVAGLGDDVSLAPAIKRVGDSMNVPVTGLFIAPADAPAAEALSTLRSSVEMLVIAADEEYVSTMLTMLGR